MMTLHYDLYSMLWYDEYDNFYGAITQPIPLQGRLDKKPVECQRYDFSKLCVFSLDLNNFRVDTDLMDVGMLLYTCFLHGDNLGNFKNFLNFLNCKTTNL